jgi:hypothetical protein
MLIQYQYQLLAALMAEMQAGSAISCESLMKMQWLQPIGLQLFSLRHAF